jgi:hypothetical protein
MYVGAGALAGSGVREYPITFVLKQEDAMARVIDLKKKISDLVERKNIAAAGGAES